MDVLIICNVELNFTANYRVISAKSKFLVDLCAMVPSTPFFNRS